MRTHTILATVLVALAWWSGSPALAQESRELPDALRELGSLMGRGLPDRAAQWRCDATSRFLCSAEGCKAVRPTMKTPWLNLDFVARTYERCDTKGCDSYLMDHSQSGKFTHVWLVGHPGIFFKSVSDGSEFVEVVSFHLDVFNVYGRCKPR